MQRYLCFNWDRTALKTSNSDFREGTKLSLGATVTFRVKQSTVTVLGVLDPEDEGGRIFRNVVYYTPSDTPLYMPEDLNL